MGAKLWSRRELMAVGVGTAVAGVGSRLALGQRMPSPQPLEDAGVRLVTTTEASAWQTGTVYRPAFGWEVLNLNVGAAVGRAMEGFGGCFNELGWTSLSALSAEDRAGVMKELFDPEVGARFTYCRMPIGANDFATEAYSYDETPRDFEMKNFSIAHDRATLVPFIQEALTLQPKLRLWASPWTPPSWMKRNDFYAEAKAFGGFKDNGIRPDQVGHEGEDMFRLEPKYLEAYARYFAKFVEAYRAEGIRVGMVMPQNEFNSAQNFPSCTWTPAGLAAFLRYLGPVMQKIGVEVFFGTLERGNVKLLEGVMNDKAAGEWVKGVGVQWAGKNALPEIHAEYPQLPVFQSEQECGDGSNSWSYTGYCWELMKDYFRNGACGYMYWNISTADGGMSTWGWRQNSLVSVDKEAKTFKWNHDYYLLKHLTHFVDVGARLVEVSGTCDDALGFVNPDGGHALLLRNELPHAQRVQVQVGGRAVMVELPADSVGTLTTRV
ncbi:MAG: beta-glycosidase [Acidobacteriaceae bacterium]